MAHEYGERVYNGESTGNKLFQGQSAPYGAEILYRLTAANTGPVKVVIQDAMGDTVRTLNGPGAVGINRVVWDFRGKTPTPEKLSPAGVRDSIATARKAVIALDSIEKEGTVPKAMLDRVRAALSSPEGLQGFATQMFAQLGGGGAGGGTAGGAPRFNERPAEAVPAAGGRRGAAPAAAEGAGEGAAPPDQNQLFGIFRALGGNLGGGGGRRGATGALVSTGDYLVTVTIGGQAQRTLLRVERVSGSGSIGGFFEDDHR